MNGSQLPEELRVRGERALQAFADTAFDEVTAAALVEVFALSDFAATAAQRHRFWFEQALAQNLFDHPATEADLRAAIAAELEDLSTDTDNMAGLQRGLRIVRQRFQLWLIWRHCLGNASLAQTTEHASAMADILIDTALFWVTAWNCSRRGEPLAADGQTAQRMVVLALGKLGARELNLSSDVDLIFAYPEAGKTRGGETNQQFFVRIGQQLIQALDALTEDGFAFRVDMRLRPYGTSGPLAMDFSGIENYYATQGRDWERYALIKARPCAGDIAAGEALLEDLRPFVYRRYLDFGAIDALRDMKAKLVAERQHPDDIKLGAGGIRDVEFSVQMQQMIWAGREQGLQSPRLLKVLPELGALGHFAQQQVDVLRDGYRFLRDTEHSLQAEADQQTQRLPESTLGQTRLARSRGFQDYAAFKAQLDSHRKAISEVFAGLMELQAQSGSPGEAIWNATDDLEGLFECGFKDAQTASERLVNLTKARDRASVSADARTRLDRLMPLLLDQIIATQTPDLALQRVLPIIRAVLRRSAYLALLRENPKASAHLVELVTMSLWLAEKLADFPAFFDALLDERTLTLVLDRSALSKMLDGQLALAGGDEERLLEVLREFKSHQVFNIALAEIRGTLSLMKVSDALTYLAETLLAASLDIAWRANVHRFPEYEIQQRFIIVGYGKLGGIELGPGSDLDLVFVHDLPGIPGPFLQRLIRRLLNILTAPTYNGALYEIDTRLRPSGGAGSMVSSLLSFGDYQLNQAWVWEHQALVRARVVAGDAELGKRFDAMRRELLELPRDPQELRESVLKMRDRIGEQYSLDNENDLKRGRGGIVDIEFMVQYLVLAGAHEHPSLTEFTDNVRILDEVERLELLPQSAALSLREAYLALRAEWHRGVLDIPDRERAARTLAEYREDVQAIWEMVFNR